MNTWPFDEPAPSSASNTPAILALARGVSRVSHSIVDLRRRAMRPSLRPDARDQEPQSGRYLRDHDRHRSKHLNQSRSAWRDQTREPDRQVRNRREDADRRQEPRDVTSLEEEVEEDRRPCAEEDRRNSGSGSEWMHHDQVAELLGVERGGTTCL